MTVGVIYIFKFLTFNIALNLFLAKYASIVYELYINYLKEQRQNSKCKILFCVEYLLGGGAEKVLIDILKHLDYNKYSVDLLVWEKSRIYLYDIPHSVHWVTINNTQYIDDTTYDIEVAFIEGLAVKYLAKKGSIAIK